MGKITLLFLLFCLLPGLASAAPDTPSDLNLTASETNITITWTPNSDEVSGYHIYYGTAPDNLHLAKDVKDPQANAYVLLNVNNSTLYYVGLSAYDETSESLLIQDSVTTGGDSEAPSVPQDFTISALEDITGSSVTFVWTFNSMADLSYYKVYYGITSGKYMASEKTSGANIRSLTVDGLNPGTRYYFILTAVDGSNNESSATEELIVDTLEDHLPPNMPILSAEDVTLSGIGTFTIDFEGNNAGMADLYGYQLYYGTQSGVYEAPLFLDYNHTAFVLDGLFDGTTYYLAVSALDRSGNESKLSDEISHEIEGTIMLTDNGTDFKDGCFISTQPLFKGKAYMLIFFAVFGIVCLLGLLFCPRRGYLKWLIVFTFALNVVSVADIKAEERNTVGLKAGYLRPSDRLHNKVYPENSYLTSMTYERLFLKYVSMDISAGYVKKRGHAVTVSGVETSINTELILVPLSSSLCFQYQLTPLIFAYAGGGIDYWHYKESSAVPAYNNDQQGYIGGYHAKAGLKLYADHEKYKNYGVVVEGIYSSIDIMERNIVDIGGWTFNIGIVRKF